MEITIRKSQEADISKIMALIHELAIFEKAPEEVSNTAEQMLKDGFGDLPLFKSIVAECSNEIVGFALYYYRYSTWKGKCLYLEDFYVREKFRSNGIGRKLFDEILCIAKTDQCKRISWQVLDWNKGAIKFYARYSAGFDQSWWNGFIDIK